MSKRDEAKMIASSLLASQDLVFFSIFTFFVAVYSADSVSYTHLDVYKRQHTTTENKVQGTGLGLSIIKSMIELMGGSCLLYTSKEFSDIWVIWMFRILYRFANHFPLRRELTLRKFISPVHYLIHIFVRIFVNIVKGLLNSKFF